MIKLIIGALFIAVSQCMILNTKLVATESWMIIVSVIMVLVGISIMILPYRNKENEERVDELDGAYSDIEKRYKNIETLINGFPESSKKNKAEQENLVVTDLFVEKDIAYLTERATELQKSARRLFGVAVGLLLIGTIIAFWNMFSESKNVVQDSFYVLLPGFVKSFTAYGLIVLTSVTLWKQSKAKFDQAERILEKRRSNRLLRIYIHLQEGNISLDEMEKLLNMGLIHTNAFSNIQAEGKAPWGAVFTDVLKYNQELLKMMGDVLKKNEAKPEAK